jgi:hypothetical protein
MGAAQLEEKSGGSRSGLRSPDASLGTRSSALATFAMQGSAMSRRSSFGDGVRAFSADEFSDEE